MNFRALREAAGLGDRSKFSESTGISLRTLSDYDNEHSAPPLVLIKYLRMLANGCQVCQMRKRANITHPAETKEK